jgi:hypothetical protein
MEKYTTGFSPNASLAVIGQWTKEKGIWKKMEAGLHIQQKVRVHTPHEKLKDLLINIWAGGEGVAEVNHRVRSDEALQKLFGRSSCAEQSTISETLNATTQTNIQEMEGVMKQILQEHSRCYRQDYVKNWLVLDIDMTGVLAGKEAEGSEKGYFSGEKNGRGRQLGRVLASQYDEIVGEQLYPGKVQLEAVLLELVKMAENTLDFDENRRKRTIVRVDGGGGTDKIIDELLLRQYWILMKVKNWQRTNKLAKTVKTWHNLPELPGHELGWASTPHEYEGATRQLVVRWLNPKKKWQYAALVFNLTDFMLFQLAGLPMPKRFTQQDLFSVILKAYNLRSGGVETSFRNSKQGLHLHKRNKKRFEAQHMLILLAQLAYNIAVWVRYELKKHSSVIASFGMFRLIRDAFRISGQVQFDDKGIVHLIILNQSHTLAKVFQKTWQSCFVHNDPPLILGKI